MASERRPSSAPSASRPVFSNTIDRPARASASTRDGPRSRDGVADRGEMAQRPGQHRPPTTRPSPASTGWRTTRRCPARPARPPRDSSRYWPASRPRSHHHQPSAIRQPHRERRVVVHGPGQHLAHGGVLGIQPPGRGHLPGAGLQPRRGLLRHPQRVAGQRGRRRVLLAGLGPQLRPVGPQRLQHHIPRPPIRRRSAAGPAASSPPAAAPPARRPSRRPPRRPPG